MGRCAPSGRIRRAMIRATIFSLAIDAGCNAYAAPLGSMEAGVREFAGEVPLILKANDHDLTADEKDPSQAFTGSVEDALRLGCSAIGFTIYPASSQRLEAYEQVRIRADEAKRHGLAVMIWSYPRGTAISKEGETAIDIVGYAAQIAAQLGAHIIKVKIPTAHIEQEEARKVFEKEQIPIATVADRVKNIVQCAFGGTANRHFLGRHLCRGRMHCWRKCAASKPEAASARLSGGTLSSARIATRSSC